ncbi:hypothetical protein AMS60_16205 [Bacillus sp. FJAT-21945]|nr:hypothetical protein AMS60_16205 [Bacillus sp. FJAT-21945]
MIKILYDEIQDTKLIPCNRSRLYPIEPKGIGTAEVESIGSYLIRLSKAHSVTLGSLLSYEYSPHFNKSYIYKYHSNTLGSAFYRYSSVVNGYGSLTENIIKATELLTLRNDIRNMTLANWNNFLPSNQSIVKTAKHWCPLCYSEWKDSGEEIYDPLIWYIKIVKICSIHKIPLQTKCPHCNNEIKTLSHHSCLDYCQHCKQSLIFQNDYDTLISAEELEIQLWICKSLGEIILCTEEYNSNSVQISLRKFREQFCDNNNNEFARLLLIEDQDRQLFDYCSGKARPSIQFLLWCSYVLNTPLKQMVKNGLLLKADSVINNFFLNERKKYIFSKAEFKKRNKVQIKSYLEFIIESNIFISTKGVAEELRMDQRHLRIMFPELCKLISAQYKKHRSENKKMQIEKKKKEIEKVMLNYFELHSSVPSIGKTGELIFFSHFALKKELFEKYDEVAKVLRAQITENRL